MTSRSPDATGSPERGWLSGLDARGRSPARRVLNVIPAKLRPPRSHQQLVHREGVVRALLEA
ncbi:MAG: hypothetical protein ACXWNQ_01910, partial [Anaerolineales bacterium]